MRPLPICSLALILLYACSENTPKVYSTYQGYAQGTTFLIEVDGENEYSIAIDSILKGIDRELSLWDSLSWISKWNSGQHQHPMGPHTIACWQLSQKYYQQSEGYFDPSLGPLIRFWGFGSSKNGFPEVIDTIALKQIRALVGLNQSLSFDSAQKTLKPRFTTAQLDFNAIAQGYSVDVLSDFLEKKGHKNYMVEIGGEVRCLGRSPQNKKWKIGIDKPISENDTRAIQAILNVEGGLATSGSYRKYYEKEGKKYAHVIDPKSGFPVSHHLVSVTVNAPTAAQADALATALLAMGTNEAIAFSQKYPELGIFLIYEENGEWQTWLSKKMKEILVETID
jgi:FAD:protein FMN transferase